MSPVLAAMFITFALSRLSTSEKSIASELQFLAGSCYPRDNCSTLQNMEDDHLWSGRACECGKHCVRHATCCIDSVHAGETPTPINEFCQNAVTTSFSVHMVSNCSTRWSQLDVTYSKCVSESDETRDPLSALPMTSLVTNTTYKNYFCAVCNNDTEQAMFWNIGLHQQDCRTEFSLSEESELQELAFSKEKKTWGFFVKAPDKTDGTFCAVKLRFKLPLPLQKIVKKCYKGMISQCDSSGENDDLRRKCYSYYDPITLPINRHNGKTCLVTYRNVHCALCNNVNSTHAGSACALPILTILRTFSRSFALLLDVNKKNGEKVGSVELCKEGQVYDPFFKKCRSVRCAMSDYVVRDGSCVKP